MLYSNTFELCYTHCHSEVFEYWDACDSIQNVRSVYDYCLSHAIPCTISLADRHLHIFFLFAGNNVMNSLPNTFHSMQVQKKTFNNLSELDTKTSAMLIHSIRNWFHTLLTKDAAYKIVGNFLFPANQFRNNPNPYVTGFTLQFFVHNKHTIRFHVHVERRKLSTLTPQDVMRRVIDNEIMVYTPVRGIPGKIILSEGVSPINNGNVMVLIEEKALSFSCDSLYLIDTEDLVNDTIDQLLQDTRDQFVQYSEEIRQEDEFMIDQSFTDITSPPPLTPPFTPLITPLFIEADSLPEQQDLVETKQPQSFQMPVATIITEASNSIKIETEDMLSKATKTESIDSMDTDVRPESVTIISPEVKEETKKKVEDVEEDFNQLGDDDDNLNMDDTEFNGLLDFFDEDEKKPVKKAEIKTQSSNIEVDDIIISPDTLLDPDEIDPTIIDTQPVAPPVPQLNFELLESNLQQLKQERKQQRQATRLQMSSFMSDLDNIVYTPYVDTTLNVESNPQFNAGISNTQQQADSQTEESLSDQFASGVDLTSVVPYYSTSSFLQEQSETASREVALQYKPDRKRKRVEDKDASSIDSYISSMKRYIEGLCRNKNRGTETQSSKRRKMENGAAGFSDSSSDSDSSDSEDEEVSDRKRRSITRTTSHNSSQFSELSQDKSIKKTLELCLSSITDTDEQLSSEEFTKLLVSVANGSWIDEDSLMGTKPLLSNLSFSTGELLQQLARSFQPLHEDISQEVSARELSVILFGIVNSIAGMCKYLALELSLDNLRVDGPLVKEPQMFELNIPNIRVGYTEQWLDVSPEIIQFWEKALLEPYCQSKKIQYCVISIQDNFTNFEDLIFPFFKDLSSVYETCKFGVHVPIDHEKLKNGVIYYDLDDTELKSDPQLFMSSFLKQLSGAVSKALQAIQTIIESIPRDESIVLYILNPFSLIQTRGSCSTHSEFFCQMLEAIAQLSAANQRANVLYQFIDLTTVISSYEARPLAVFKQIAMDTYNKCRRTRKWQNRKFSDYFSMLYEPMLVLPPSVPCLSSNCLPQNDIKNIEHQHIIMNCTYSIIEHGIDNINNLYCVSVAVVWSDCTGHLLESDVLNNKCEIAGSGVEPLNRAKEMVYGSLLQDIHNRSMMYMASLAASDQRTNFYYWDYVVCKLGKTETSFDTFEMKVWKAIFDQLSQKDLASIGSMCIISATDDPPLQLLVDSIPQHTNPAENSNSFVLVDEPGADSALLKSNHQVFNRHTAKSRAYIVSSLNRNPFILKERYLESSRSQTTINVSISEQEYHILELCLFQMKQIAVSGQHDWIPRVCKEFHDLSWLTVSPSHPFRETHLPLHMKLLQSIVKNVTNYHLNKLCTESLTETKQLNSEEDNSKMTDTPSSDN